MNGKSVILARKAVKFRFRRVCLFGKVAAAVYVKGAFRSRHRLVYNPRPVDVGVSVGIDVVAVRTLCGVPHKLKSSRGVHLSL